MQYLLTLIAAASLLSLNACTSTTLPDSGSPIAETMETLPQDVRTYHEHVTTLANPFFEGRLPGSRGITDAESYIAFHFERIGLTPAFNGAWFQHLTFPANKGYTMPIQDTGEPPIQARNVGAIIPGRGELGDELIVVGAHHDHLGRHHVDQRDHIRDIHFGADDNASGVAGVLVLAEQVQRTLAEDSRDRRAILFITFSGEESGRFGSLHYLEHPVVPMNRHSLMINFDMIGRLQSGRVSVYGARNDPWLMDLMTRHGADSGLDVRLDRTPMAGSDHVGFEERNVPVLFCITKMLHDDYHTVRDVSWKISSTNATRLVRIFHDVVIEAAASE